MPSNEEGKTKTIGTFHFFQILGFNWGTYEITFFFPPQGAIAPSGQGLLTVEVSRSPSDTRHSVRLLWTSDRPYARDLLLTKHNTHKRQISRPTAGLEPVIPASERPQTHALDRAASGFGIK
jgi:hypothetical protein